MSCFVKKFCKQILIACTLTCGCLHVVAIWDKKEKHLTQLICHQGCVRQEWVRINNKNKKHFSMTLNIQVCELSQVLAKADIKRCYEN